MRTVHRRTPDRIFLHPHPRHTRHTLVIVRLYGQIELDDNGPTMGGKEQVVGVCVGGGEGVVVVVIGGESGVEGVGGW